MGKMFSLKKKSINEPEINRKSKKKLTIILAIIMIVLFVGVSYAAFYYNFTGNENLLNAESIELEVLENDSEIISVTNALPMTDTQGIAQEETFDFAVTTRTAASTNIYYNLKIEKLAVDTGYTSLEDEDIRVYLTDYNNKALIGPIKISDLSNYTFYKTYNSHTSEATEVTAKFKLKVWLDQEVDSSNWTETTKLQYKFKIGVAGNEYRSDTVNLSQKVIPEGAYYLSMDAETGAPTIQTEIPETVSEMDMYVYGDYMYVYMADAGGWAVLLATEESFGMFGATEVLADYPVTDKNQTSYDPILETVNNEPVTTLYATFNGCTSLQEVPVIPKSVMLSSGSFGGTLLKSNTNIYSYYVGDLFEASTLDTITNYTTDYKSLNKSVFLKHNIGNLGRIESQEVCYILNGEKYCLKGGGIISDMATFETEALYYEENIETLYASFGEENCSDYSINVNCLLSGIRAYASDDGSVHAGDDDWYCGVISDGLAICFE